MHIHCWLFTCKPSRPTWVVCFCHGIHLSDYQSCFYFNVNHVPHNGTIHFFMNQFGLVVRVTLPPGLMIRVMLWPRLVVSVTLWPQLLVRVILSTGWAFKVTLWSRIVVRVTLWSTLRVRVTCQPVLAVLVLVENHLHQCRHYTLINTPH